MLLDRVVYVQGRRVASLESGFVIGRSMRWASGGRSTCRCYVSYKGAGGQSWWGVEEQGGRRSRVKLEDDEAGMTRR